MRGCLAAPDPAAVGPDPHRVDPARCRGLCAYRAGRHQQMTPAAVGKPVVQGMARSAVPFLRRLGPQQLMLAYLVAAEPSRNGRPR
jgi:hypothetical protein